VNQKGFANTILVLIIITCVSVAGYFTFTHTTNSSGSTTTPQPPTGLGKYNTEPIVECVECVNGRSWNNKPCCTANFEKDCTSKNGVIRFTDLHPAFTILRSCFQKAPDTGKECASATDCLSGICDLESAIKNNKCSLIKKELASGKNQYYGQEFFTATYSCSVIKPGVCMETIENRLNPGGVSHSLRMNGKILIETLESGPIF
jgi:hypothetical protein